jgi:2-dehydro-3-deoxyphosphogluconate aldolase / (4S)-4-hydroxy-2-oxoglutarate aldolase
MYKKEEIIAVIKQQGTIPLFYHPNEEITVGTVDALYQAGIRVFEYTNRGDHALANFKALVKTKAEKWPDLILGIGTIKTVKDVSDYVNAGADFIICPGVFAEVAEACKKLNIFWVPGCMTPTEIVTAEALGAHLVKIFPGNVVGAGFISAVKDLFPKLLFMPTGGVDGTEENLRTWFSAGAIAVGMGSKLIDKKTLDEKLYTDLTERTIQALALIKKIST